MENGLTPKDINHLRGQLVGQRALILALAASIMSKDQFREAGLQGLEAARTAFLPTLAPDSTRDGIDEVETWLLNVTG